MPAPINISVPALPAFNQAFLDYVRVSKKLPSVVVAEKGNDVRIKAMLGFKSVAFKKGRKGGVWREQMRRFKRGGGIRVNAGRRRRAYGGDLTLHAKRAGWGNGDKPVTKDGKKLNRSQAAAWLEIASRSAGIGILGVSLLDRRYRKGKATTFSLENGRWKGGGRTRYLVQNNSSQLGSLASWKQDENMFQILMNTPGADTVSNRYGIADRAIGTVTADMDKYLTRKANEAAQGTLARYK